MCEWVLEECGFQWIGAHSARSYISRGDSVRGFSLRVSAHFVCKRHFEPPCGESPTGIRRGLTAVCRVLKFDSLHLFSCDWWRMRCCNLCWTAGNETPRQWKLEVLVLLKVLVKKSEHISFWFQNLQIILKNTRYYQRSDFDPFVLQFPCQQTCAHLDSVPVLSLVHCLIEFTNLDFYVMWVRARFKVLPSIIWKQ